MKRPALLSSEARGEIMLKEEGEEEVDDVYCSARGVGVGGKKRRLEATQVQALERSFDIENKLEADRKARLAYELGLQPRQVAVWFQNRRAWWKTKQLERDFNGLKSCYEALRVEFDSLSSDNNSLLAELSVLRSKLCPAAYSDAKQQEEKKMKIMSAALPPPADSDSSPGVLTDDDNRLESGVIYQAQQLFKMEGSSFLCLDQEPSALVSGVSTLDWLCSDLTGNGDGVDGDGWL